MEFFTTIAYSQVNVFEATVPEFNDWTDDHVAQGFSWRSWHVSFGLPDHDGESLIEVRVTDTPPELSDDVERAVEVPFKVLTQGVVATVFDEIRLNVAPGPYALQFRVRPGNPKDRERPYTYRIELIFVPGESERFAILRRSGEMVSDRVLTTYAEPAT